MLHNLRCNRRQFNMELMARNEVRLGLLITIFPNNFPELGRNGVRDHPAAGVPPSGRRGRGHGGVRPVLEACNAEHRLRRPFSRRYCWYVLFLLLSYQLFRNQASGVPSADLQCNQPSTSRKLDSDFALLKISCRPGFRR